MTLKALSEFRAFVNSGDLRSALEKHGERDEVIDLVVRACQEFIKSWVLSNRWTKIT